MRWLSVAQEAGPDLGQDVRVPFQVSADPAGSAALLLLVKLTRASTCVVLVVMLVRARRRATVPWRIGRPQLALRRLRAARGPGAAANGRREELPVSRCTSAEAEMANHPSHRLPISAALVRQALAAAGEDDQHRSAHPHVHERAAGWLDDCRHWSDPCRLAAGQYGAPCRVHCALWLPRPHAQVGSPAVALRR